MPNLPFLSLSSALSSWICLRRNSGVSERRQIARHASRRAADTADDAERSVSCWTALTHPRPPAFVTAAARSGPAATSATRQRLAAVSFSALMPARQMGLSMPKTGPGQLRVDDLGRTVGERRVDARHRVE